MSCLEVHEAYGVYGGQSVQSPLRLPAAAGSGRDLSVYGAGLALAVWGLALRLRHWLLLSLAGMVAGLASYGLLRRSGSGAESWQWKGATPWQQSWPEARAALGLGVGNEVRPAAIGPQKPNPTQAKEAVAAETSDLAGGDAHTPALSAAPEVVAARVSAAAGDVHTPALSAAQGAVAARVPATVGTVHTPALSAAQGAVAAKVSAASGTVHTLALSAAQGAVAARVPATAGTVYTPALSAAQGAGGDAAGDVHLLALPAANGAGLESSSTQVSELLAVLRQAVRAIDESRHADLRQSQRMQEIEANLAKVSTALAALMRQVPKQDALAAQEAAPANPANPAASTGLKSASDGGGVADGGQLEVDGSQSERHRSLGYGLWKFWAIRRLDDRLYAQVEHLPATPDQGVDGKAYYLLAQGDTLFHWTVRQVDVRGLLVLEQMSDGHLLRLQTGQLWQLRAPD